MAVTLNASTSNGLIQTADTTGNLSLQSNGTTIAALTSTGLAVTGAGSFSTTLGVTGTSTVAAVNASGKITSTVGNNGIVLENLSATTGYQYLRLVSTGASGLIGIDSSVGGVLGTGTTAYSTVLSTQNATSLHLVSNSVVGLTLASGGAVTIPGTLGVTGAATFSSSITVTSGAIVRNIALNNGVSCGGLYPYFTFAGSGDNSPLLVSDVGLELHFATNGSATKRMTIGTAGAVTIPGTVSTSNYYTVTGGAGQVTLDNTGLYQVSWPTTASPANTNVANNSYAKLVTSLRANKTEITSISEKVATDTVMAMRGVTYRSAIDEDQREWAGFIAEETKDANPTLAMFDESGALQSISYDRIPAYMIPVLQKHEREIQALRAELQQLRTSQ